MSVDVKGDRHLDCIWLETVNVNGDKGWLKGEAQFIVFDIIDELNSFFVVKEERFITLCRRNNVIECC